MSKSRISATIEQDHLARLTELALTLSSSTGEASNISRALRWLLSLEVPFEQMAKEGLRYHQPMSETVAGRNTVYDTVIHHPTPDLSTIGRARVDPDPIQIKITLDSSSDRSGSSREAPMEESPTEPPKIELIRSTPSNPFKSALSVISGESSNSYTLCEDALWAVELWNAHVCEDANYEGPPGNMWRLVEQRRSEGHFRQYFEENLARALSVPELWGKGRRAREDYMLVLPALLGAHWKPILANKWRPFARGKQAYDRALEAVRVRYEGEEDVQSSATPALDIDVKSVAPRLEDVECSPQAQAFWSVMAVALQEQIGEEHFNIWFRRTKPTSLNAGVLTLAVPNEHYFEWFNGRYAVALQTSVQAAGGLTVKLATPEQLV